MYILGEFLSAILDVNLQFFIDLVLNNLVWLFIFVVLASVFYAKKGLILGTILVALGIFLFSDLLVLFSIPSVLSVIPLIFLIIAIFLFFWLEGTSFEKHSITILTVLALFIGWLLV
ncbi:MAG: hypothetical protein Q7S21_00745 [archaeon]|nr:hypothetical protein [archaeon]